MTIILKDLVIGEHYVYLDGHVISVAKDSVHIDGWHSRHDLEFVPQFASLRDTRIISDLLASADYWRSTAIPDEND